MYEESGDIIVNCCSKAKSEKGRSIARRFTNSFDKHWMHGCVTAALEMADGHTITYANRLMQSSNIGRFMMHLVFPTQLVGAIGWRSEIELRHFNQCYIRRSSIYN